MLSQWPRSSTVNQHKVHADYSSLLYTAMQFGFYVFKAVSVNYAQAYFTQSFKI